MNWKFIKTIAANGITINLWSLIGYKLFHGLYTIGIGNIIYSRHLVSLDAKGLLSLGAINFINAMIFSIGYRFLYKGLPGEGIKKGLSFGLFIWLIGCAVPIARIFFSINMITPIFVYWVLLHLIFDLSMGAITSAIYGNVRKDSSADSGNPQLR